MSLTLYFHPLSSFSHKVLIALYENATPFEPRILHPDDAALGARFKALWPIGKFPVLRDEARQRNIPESSIIIEYLDQHYPGATRFVPEDAEHARQMRGSDRFFDLYIHAPMQKIVADTLRPAGKNDAHGVEEARTMLATALGMLDREMAGKTWAMGDAFTMADCAAAPALFYASQVMPFAATHANAAAYLQRLRHRPSFARVLAEARPYFNLFPQAAAAEGAELKRSA